MCRTTRSPDEASLSGEVTENSRSMAWAKVHRAKRPHTKSRRGCFNCKARKVKCPETRPACKNCMIRDLECVYPAEEVSERIIAPKRDFPSLVSTRQLSPHPFTGDDLRFFHHFLLDARPYLPFGNEQSWKVKVPAYAHECPHLMHALLSLGATDCSVAAPDGSQYTSMAIAHRGKAIQLLSTAIAKGDQCTNVELDCILATCYALVFQAHHMADGVVDFAVMVRGCGMVTSQIRTRFQSSGIFFLQDREEVTTMVTPWLPEEPYPDSELLVRCLEDVDQIEPLLESSVQQGFLTAIRRTYRGLQRSIGQGFEGITEIYSVWYSADSRQFMKFIAGANYLSRALFIHYFMIDTLMRPYLFRLHGVSDRLSRSFNAMVINQWTETIWESLPREVQEMVRFEVDFIAREKGMVWMAGDGSPLIG
ncbi:hypothetical protein FE257_008494 [Aspergillus nanangensis]|uniref:Zn(2)-C6 fungal-type domain-containing protein n=1 Tax=Aspergillus nanangensis TaxID=2582783 RepID=A0AAD4CLJ5_ASPNN|nr:hypothetical protein FE257_008494 [Aspergillus nanangensis]